MSVTDAERLAAFVQHHEAEVAAMAAVIEAAERWDIHGDEDSCAALSRALAVYHGADDDE